MYVILFYDIVQKEKTNANRIRKAVEKYLPRVQYSVFEGEMRASDLKKLKAFLQKEIHNELDSVIIYEFEKPSYTKRDVIGIDKKENIFS